MQHELGEEEYIQDTGKNLNEKKEIYGIDLDLSGSGQGPVGRALVT
jgi:hypothetical protein